MKLSLYSLIIASALLTGCSSARQASPAFYSAETHVEKAPLMSAAHPLQTRYFTVTLPPAADPSSVARRINGSAVWWKEFDLAHELDKLYEEVLDVTELYKPSAEKININFCNDLTLAPRSGARHTSASAAYVHENGTILVTLQDARREVLAHEMTHAALHQYAGVRLSRKVDEALAMWAASKLE